MEMGKVSKKRNNRNNTHTHIQRRNQQVNRRHIKLTYLLTAPEPARAHAAKKLEIKT